MGWEDYGRFHRKVMRVMLRVMLWFWLVVGAVGAVTAAVHPAQTDRVVTLLAFAAFAAVGGGGLLWRKRIDAAIERFRPPV